MPHRSFAQDVEDIAVDVFSVTATAATVESLTGSRGPSAAPPCIPPCSECSGNCYCIDPV